VTRVKKLRETKQSLRSNIYRKKAINRSELGYAPHDLVDLDAPFRKHKKYKLW
jgi:hypothetical protein